MAGSNPSSHQTIIRRFDPAAIAEAAALIRAGDCVAVPTETVYGLAADATSADAVARIYAAKGRPSFNPLIIHVADLAQAERLGLFDAPAHALAHRYWPGPLTLVVPARPDCPVAHIARAGLPTIALRVPAHPAMRALLLACGTPLAAPSANASGSVSPTTAAHVQASLEGRVALIIDGGACDRGIESTILAALPHELAMLRAGPLTREMIEAETGLTIADDAAGTVRAPGALLRHYAPGKPVLLDCSEPPADAFTIGFGSQGCDYQLSATGDLVEAAAHLFDALHAGAASAHPRIAVAPIPDSGLGVAINDRLRRSAA